MSGISVAAILRSPDVQAVAQAAARDMKLRAHVASGFTAATLRTLDGDVLLIDMDVRSQNEMRALQEFIAAEQKPVIVTSPHLDVPTMRELFGLGVSDALPQPFAEEELMAALRNAASRLRAAQGPQAGRMISFLKSGGGVGSTTLVVQSACALTHRKNDMSVAVLDFDLQFGGTALQTDAEQHVSLLDLVRAPERLDAMLLHGAMVRPHSRFYLLTPPKEMPEVEGIDAHAIASVLKIARSQYALTLVDLPLFWSPWIHEAIRRSDVIVLVTTLTVASLRQARRQIDTMAREGLGKVDLKIVANRVARGWFRGSGIGLKEAETALGRKIDYAIPDSAVFSRAANAGVPLDEMPGGPALAKRIARMMRETSGEKNVEA